MANDLAVEMIRSGKSLEETANEIYEAELSDDSLNYVGEIPGFRDKLGEIGSDSYNKIKPIMDEYLSAFFKLPSAIRSYYEDRLDIMDSKNPKVPLYSNVPISDVILEGRGFLLSFIFNSTIAFSSPLFLGSGIYHNKSGFIEAGLILGVPLATNIASGIYETGRHLWKKSSEKVNERYETKRQETLALAKAYESQPTPLEEKFKELEDIN